MTKKRNDVFHDRVIEAKFLARNSVISGRDKQGRARKIYTPGSDATRNMVLLSRQVNGTVDIVVECHKDVGQQGLIPCKGNGSGVCRHSLAAVILALQDEGYVPRFRKSYDDIEKLAQSKKYKDVALEDKHGDVVIFQVVSKQGRRAAVWMIALEEDLVAEAKEAGKSL